MQTIGSVIDFLEQWAPPALAEDYDNVGLLVGRPERKVTKILVSLDATEDVVDEAIRTNCELVVSHHPILFRGIKRLNGQNYVARTVEKAIENQVGLYAIHTNLDNVETGVNARIAEELGLINPRILQPKAGLLLHLTFFVPPDAEDRVLSALHQAGAGEVGNYFGCSFSSEGSGRFTPDVAANPAIGQRGRPESVREKRVDILVPEHCKTLVIKALVENHPYEEVAYFLSPTENQWHQTGSGMIGDLPAEVHWEAFVPLLKSAFGLDYIKHTLPPPKVKRIALCGGSGFFLLKEAIRQKADVLVTSDIKYHEFFDAENRLALVDIGHYESEQFTSHLLVERLSANFPNIAVLLSNVRTNPVFYA